MNWYRTINTPKAMKKAVMGPRPSTSVPPEANAYDTDTSSDSTNIDMVFMASSFYDLMKCAS